MQSKYRSSAGRNWSERTHTAGSASETVPSFSEILWSARVHGSGSSPSPPSVWSVHRLQAPISVQLPGSTIRKSPSFSPHCWNTGQNRKSQTPEVLSEVSRPFRSHKYEALPSRRPLCCCERPSRYTEAPDTRLQPAGSTAALHTIRKHLFRNFLQIPAGKKYCSSNIGCLLLLL